MIELIKNRITDYGKPKIGNEQRAKLLFASFNAWEYEQTLDMAAGLTHEVIGTFLKDMRFMDRLKLQVRFAWQHHRGTTLASVILGSLLIIFTLCTGLALLIHPPEASNLSGGLGALGSILVLLGGITVFIERSQRLLAHPFVGGIFEHIEGPAFHKHLGLVHVLKNYIRFFSQTRLGEMDSGAPIKRLIIFVDDLDRCSSESIIKTLEAVRLVTSLKNVFTLIAVDQRIVFSAVTNHYEGLKSPGRAPDEIARDYLGKIIQVPIKLNLLEAESLRQFVEKDLFPDLMREEESRKPSGAHPASADSPETNSPNADNASPEFNHESRPAHDAAASQTNSFRESESRGHPFDTDGIETQILLETREECELFFELVKKFKFNNPRQLKRLRNTYELIRALPQKEGEWRIKMVMLFWQERLHLSPSEFAEIVEHRLLNSDANTQSFSDDLYSSPHAQELETYLRLQFQLDKRQGKENYAALARFVYAFVLPRRKSADLPS